MERSLCIVADTSVRHHYIKARIFYKVGDDTLATIEEHKDYYKVYKGAPVNLTRCTAVIAKNQSDSLKKAQEKAISYCRQSFSFLRENH